MTHRQSTTTPAPIDWGVIAPPRPDPPDWAKREMERQAAEPLQTYLGRLTYQQA